MLRIPCPKCRKTSYTADLESFYPCNYCGLRFSGKYGSDRRQESRVGKVIPLIFPYKGQNLEASTLDVSENGIGIKISGKPSIIVGDVLNLAMGDLSMAAKVMWIKNLSGGAIAGIQKRD